VDTSNDIRDFLTSRRAKISPEQAGLPAYGGSRRRVQGLRREEVALLAGISVEYYTRLERGNATGASEDVLDGIARALQLDEAEQTHLLDLVRIASPGRPTRRRPSQDRVRPTVLQILNSISGPAYLRNGRLDILATNPLGAALYSEVLDDPVRPANTARFVFLSPRAPLFFPDWETHARDTVAILRAEAGRDPHDRALSDLIGQLSTRSEEFRVRWAAHNVKLHRTGTKHLHHPVVGELTLAYESLELASDPGQRMLVYTAEPASPSAEALSLLASWATTEVPAR
jgi:transcriptional regulator with XRE-family HTH domain